MTPAEIFSTSIAFFSLCISGFTYYKTLIARFKPLVILRPKLILTTVILRRTNEIRTPFVIVGCDIINEGAKAGLIDDFELELKCIGENSGQSMTYQLKPLSYIENFRHDKLYKASDFEPFTGISLARDGKTTLYILFGVEDGRLQMIEGDVYVILKSRSNKSPKWDNKTTPLSFHLPQSFLITWHNDGKTVVIESNENKKIRKELLQTA